MSIKTEMEAIDMTDELRLSVQIASRNLEIDPANKYYQQELVKAKESLEKEKIRMRARNA